MEVVDLLRRDGVAVVYVSHRLDEVFRLVRRGDRAARRAPGTHRPDRARSPGSSSSRRCSAASSSEVARAQDAVRSTRALRRTRRAGAASDRPDPTPRAGRRDGRGARRRGRRARPACSDRAGPRPPRPSTAPSRSTAARSRSRASAVKRGIAARRDLGRDRADPRGPQGRRASSRRCPCARTSCSPRCRRISRAGFVSRAPAGRARRDAHDAACGSRRRAPISGSASCPAATSRRSCSPASCASSHGCCCSTIRPAASTSAPRPRSRA